MRPPWNPDLFAANRRRLLDALAPGEALLVFASRHHHRNADSEYRFRQSSDLYYLTGWEDPDAAAFIRPDDKVRFALFVQPKDPEREVWTGVRPGPEGALEQYGADVAFPIADLEEQLADLLLGVHTLHYYMGEDAERDRLVRRAIDRADRKSRKETWQDVPNTFVDPEVALHELRLFKSDEELDLLRHAAAVTCEAHVSAMRMTAPGVHEYELEVAIDSTFRRLGGEGPGYGTIVGGGKNATVLHYVTNRDPLLDGDLVCVDAGCEYGFYTADVTRTWPVNGRFSDAQAELYDLVLSTELACIDLVRPGTPVKALQETAVRLLTEGMVRLGLLTPGDGGVDGLIADEKYKRYYMHGVGHWLGLDVHDAGRYVREGTSRPLEPGMVTTIEPGLYVSPDDEEAPERFRGIGIRIEDDVLVTEGDPVVLTAAIPKSREAIEAVVGAGAVGVKA